MGGHALKINTVRKTTYEYNKIQSIIVPILKDRLDTDIQIVKCYHTKTSHGDMDVLIKIDNKFYNKNINLVDFIKNTFNPNDIYNNGGVISFDYENFQIDFIPIKESNWNFAVKWFAYDPFSNITGKIAHKKGLKFGWNGLIYPFRNFNGRLSTDILISMDHKKSLEFLGYDYDRYLLGFDTLQDIFDYIVTSKYFDSTIFQMENLNQIDRKRNRKRQTYQQFLEFIKTENINKSYSFKKKEDYILDIAEYFPESDLINKLKELEIKDGQNKEMNSKFNGKLVMTIYPDLKGKELGNMITNFMKSFDNYRDFVLQNTSEEIMNEFKIFYEKERGN